MTYMFVQLFRDSLNEYAYSADLAGLKWELSHSKYGLSVSMQFPYFPLMFLDQIRVNVPEFSS